MKMKINRKQQRGATLITWLFVAGLGLLMASGFVKIVPYYIEFNNVKGLMKNIASSPGIRKANMRQISSKIEKHLNINQLYALETAYYNSKQGTSAKKRTKNPFSLKTIKKNNKRVLTVNYDVPQPWIGNLSLLMEFNHSVILGEPDEAIEVKRAPDGNDLRKQKIRLN